MDSFIRAAIFNDKITKQPSHYHDSHQLIFIKKGEIEISINGNVKNAHSGDIIIVSRFENHSIRIKSSEYERYILRINNNLPTHDRIFSIFINRPENFSNTISTADTEKCFESILEKIVTEFGQDDEYSIQLQNLLLNQLLIYICRLLPQEINSLNQDGLDFVFDLQKEFENNYFFDYSLKELANRYNVSVSTLSHSFKKIAGVSVFDYLLSCRMAVAKRLLAKTNMSVGEIVSKCGFSDGSNFSRTFKKLNGISPTDFRNKYKF